MELYTKDGTRVDRIEVDAEVEFYNLTNALEFAKVLKEADLEVNDIIRDRFAPGIWKVVFAVEGSINFPILKERW